MAHRPELTGTSGPFGPAPAPWQNAAPKAPPAQGYAASSWSLLGEDAAPARTGHAPASCSHRKGVLQQRRAWQDSRRSCWSQQHAGPNSRAMILPSGSGPSANTHPSSKASDRGALGFPQAQEGQVGRGETQRGQRVPLCRDRLPGSWDVNSLVQTNSFSPCFRLGMSRVSTKLLGNCPGRKGGCQHAATPAVGTRRHLHHYHAQKQSAWGHLPWASPPCSGTPRAPASAG